ncbi:MAG: isochorismatase family protein [Steroidobacteraceae bacterium]|jgi:maleamate amidohydrolase|nr:isochorismatase family protein [Steroidobacteraceae bacterium]
MTDRDPSYAAAGYSSTDIGAGTRPAVLVVDLQLAFTDPKYPIGNLPMIHAATERTAELLKVARRKNVPVAKCYTAYGSLADMPRWKVKPVRDEFFYGHPCTEMDPRVHDPHYDFTFCKNAPSIFFHTPLITFLAKHQVDTLLVTGCTTSGCVRASIVDGFSYGFRVLVPEDCCGDADRRPHEDNLRDVGRRYADVTTGAEAMRYLEGLA